MADGAVARRVAPAIIHAGSGHRGYETALVGAALREHIRRPLVYEVRSFFESTWSADAAWNERGEQYHRRHDAETAAMRRADHVVTIAEAMREDIIARGVDPERVSVIPNGVDANAFTPQPPDPALRARYALDGRFAFGYVSNLDHPRENQELLVEATAILLKRGREVDLPDHRRRSSRRAEIEWIARKSGVGGRVIFTGRSPTMRWPPTTRSSTRSWSRAATSGRPGPSPRSSRTRRWRWPGRSSSPTCRP